MPMHCIYNMKFSFRSETDFMSSTDEKFKKGPEATPYISIMRISPSE